MAFTRFNYDPCRTKKILQESTGPGRWVMNQPGNGETPLFFDDPHIRMQQWGANLMSTPSGVPIDIASDLDGRTRRATKYCTPSQFPNHGVVPASKVQYPSYTSFTDETRASHPAWMYRDLEQTRWEYPLLDPQENVCKPFHNNMNTRLIAIDNYKPKPPCPWNK